MNIRIMIEKSVFEVEIFSTDKPRRSKQTYEVCEIEREVRRKKIGSKNRFFNLFSYKSIVTFTLLSSLLLGAADPEKITVQERFRVVLEPKNRTILSAEVRSPVKKVTKKLGEPFQKGDVLVQLDETIYQAHYERTQAEEVKAETDLEAKEQLYQDEIASLFELRKAEADFVAATAKRIEAKQILDATTIRAPYNGKVVTVFVNEYELPDVGDELMEVVDDEVLIAQILVPSRWLPYIWTQRDFMIELEGTGEKIPAKIKRIGAVIDPSSATIPIEAEIDNRDHYLLAGMRGRAIFQFEKTLPTPHQPLAVPDAPAAPTFPEPKTFLLPSPKIKGENPLFMQDP